MYADESRIKDLQNLKHLLHDSYIPLSQKKIFRKTITKIQTQLRDKKLALMRERLIKAHVYSDREAIWKISNQIRDYQGEDLMEKETMV